MASIESPGSGRITVAEAKQKILEASPRELFMDFYVSPDGSITTVADGVPKSIFAAHLDEDFAENCEALGIIPRWKYRPGKTGYTGDPATDDQYTVTQEELNRLASLHGLTLGAGEPPSEEFVTGPRSPAQRAVANEPAPDRGRHLKRAALIAANERRWPTIERDLRDAAANGLSAAARDTTSVGWWWENSALNWARARSKVTESSHGLEALPSLIHRMK